MDSAITKEYYSNIKKRTLAIQRAIIEFDNEITDKEEVKKLECEIFRAYEPKTFSGTKSAEIQVIKAYENTCTIIESELGANAKGLTVLEFYTKFEFIKQRNKMLKK